MGEAAKLQSVERPVLVVGQPVVQRGEAGFVQHGGPHELVVEVLIDVADAARELGDVFLRGGLAMNVYLPLKVAGIIMRNQPVKQLAKRRFAGAVAADDGGEGARFNR
ncbi:hypothetical protein D3C76_1133970 [compost metagenome]